MNMQMGELRRHFTNYSIAMSLRYYWGENCGEKK